MMRKEFFVLMLLIPLFLNPLSAQPLSGSIKGVVKEKSTGITMPAVNVIIEGTHTGTSTDADGAFSLEGLAGGKYNLLFTYISYEMVKVEGVEVTPGASITVDVVMSEASVELRDVVVVATKRNDSEVTIMNNTRNSPAVVSGISAQLISKTQDKDASEIVKRLPGVSVVDDRFIVVRGLSSRYNNVWLNKSAVPSLESDTRSFSFDLVPASMIENIMILKSPSAELPADYSGGFIKIETNGIPAENSITFSYGTSFRQYTTFGTFKKEKGGETDWLTTGMKYRSLPESMPSHLDEYETATNPEIYNRVTTIGRSLNQNWEAASSTARPDQKLSIILRRRFEKGSFIAGNVTALTYGYSNRYNRILNNSYSIYNYRSDVPSVIDEFGDDQYKSSARIGLMHNWTLYPSHGIKVDFRNFMTRMMKSAVTLREGQEWYNDGRHIRSGELRTTYKTIYSGQLAAEKKMNEDKTAVDLTFGYSLSLKDEPDIKRYRYISNEDETTPYVLLFGSNPDLSSESRMWLALKERGSSVNMNFRHAFEIRNSVIELKTGLYGEERNRGFDARNFGYALASNASTFTSTSLSLAEIFAPENINLTDGIKLKEITALSDSYSAMSRILAAYAGLNVKLGGSADITMGVRVEQSRQELSSYKTGTTTPVNVVRDTVNIFPSAGMAYNLSSKSLLRLTYGLSVNRPEFREMAPFYFVDFDQNAGIYGNEDIKQAYVHNVDLRYEVYPDYNETFNLGVFYKAFSNPIEVAIRGNNPTQFSFDNVSFAYSYGIEAEARKSLGFITSSLEDFSIVLNLALIKSSVAFDRPLQGQSPYIVNACIFYQNSDRGIKTSLVYNRTGKRIIAVGRPSSNYWESIPDIYEMPRNEVDISFSRKIGEKTELKAGIKDLFGEQVVNQQNIDAVVDMSYYGSDGYKTFNRSQITRSYYPGREYSIQMVLRF